MKIKSSYAYMVFVFLGLCWIFVSACNEENGNGTEEEFLDPLLELYVVTDSIDGDRIDLTIVLTSDAQVRDAYVRIMSGTGGPNPMDVIAASTYETLVLIFPYIDNRELDTYNGDEHEGVVYFDHHLFVDGNHITRENTVNEYIGDVTFRQIPRRMNETAVINFSYHRAGSTEKLFDMEIVGDVGYETHFTVE